ncbi:Phosphoribulokinase [Sulfobacillus acidophilus DSM 10332]|uniref:Phosphoribulokinase n=2 Tax=Sulfobacillus acidophilus TaxID=53633 RepID=G8TZ47_SULAD|nr:phosphoribulokinase [Sulfobacillus acidophilus DSM 10332]AEW06317.1 Phosphoribulokinase [Sulfobacillus acidophilus DSM 10332]
MNPSRRVVMVGICGDSGAGKSTYAHALRELLDPERVTVITLDDYHSLNRHERNAIGITALHPWKANNLGLLTEHVWALRRGQSIVKPTYDHATGEFGAPEEIVPRDIVILEGLHTFYLERLREALDLKIYFDTDIQLRVQWKIARDSSQRGYTPEEVMAEIERRRPDVERYIEPQKALADIVIHYLPDNETPPHPDYPDPVRVRFAERLRGSKRRLVKWLALAGQLGLIQTDHFHDHIIGEEMEIASVSGITDSKTLNSLIEMVSERQLVTERVRQQLEARHHDPVIVSRILVASMIAHLGHQSRQDVSAELR